MVQTAPLSAARLSCLEKLDDGATVHAKTLEALLLDPWWKARRAKVWDTAPHESTSEPIMRQLIEVMKDDSIPFGAAVLEEKWQLAQSRVPQWQQNLRSGATADVLAALVARAQLDTGRATAAEPSPETLRAVHALSSRVQWLATVAKPHSADIKKIGDELTALVLDQDARVRLSSGNALLATLEGESTITADDAQLLSDAYDGCVGLPAPTEVLTSMKQVFVQLSEQQTLTGNHCKLAGLLANFLGDADSLAHTHGGESHVMTSDTRVIAAKFEKTRVGMALSEAVVVRPGEQKEVRLARLSEALLEYETDCVTAVMPVAAAQVATAVEEATGELSTEYETSLQALCAKATSAAAALAAAAGGGKEAHQSWKAALTTQSSLDDVAREAQYFLFPGGISITQKLDELFIQVDKAWGDMEKAKKALETLAGRPVDMPGAHLTKEKEDAKHSAKVTGMEAKFMEAFALAGEKRSKMLKGHIAAMGKHRISPEELEPILWTHAQKLLAGRAADSRAASAGDKK